MILARYMRNHICVVYIRSIIQNPTYLIIAQTSSSSELKELDHLLLTTPGNTGRDVR